MSPPERFVRSDCANAFLISPTSTYILRHATVNRVLVAVHHPAALGNRRIVRVALLLPPAQHARGVDPLRPTAPDKRRASGGLNGHGPAFDDRAPLLLV
eukprot:1880688-Alexandrium_andersonii.AAC.2